jgi:acyl carrier protein
MTKEEILAKVTDIIKDTFGVEDIEVTNETVADDIPGWDSLSHTVLMMTLEQGFGIELSGSTTYRNVGDLVDVIERAMKDK